MIAGLRDAIVLLHGWRANLLALMTGAITALGLAPFHVWPVVFITFPLLVWLLDGAVPLARRDGRRRGLLGRAWPAFRTGWLFGFGYFLASLWWIGQAFLVEAETFLWLLPIAVIALPAGLALFWGAACALARAAWVDVGWRAPFRLLALAAAFGGMEWLRGTILTGFPWNLPGYIAMPSPVAMQSAALVGVYGITVLTILAACLPALLADRRGAWLAVPGLLLLIGGHIGYGVYALGQATDDTVPGVNLRIVQPAIAQDEKWIGTNEDAIMARYLEGSNANTGPRTASVAAFSHIIWPESAFPFILTQRPDRLAEIGALLPEGTSLITGGMRMEDAVGEGEQRVFNALYLLDDRGTIRTAADKTQLVPFGEYLPLRDWLSAIGLRRLVPGNGGFVPGNRRAALNVPGAPALLPLICYEIIFSGTIVPEGERPGWIVNLTNDAWFGDTPGPRQHLHQAQVRAVEQGLPVVRAANSGISAIIDANGRIRQKLDLGLRGTVDGALPVARSTTTFATFGNLSFLIFVCIAYLLSVVSTRFGDRRL